MSLAIPAASVSTDTIAEQKKRLRGEVRAARKALDEGAREQAAMRVTRRFLEALPVMRPGAMSSVVAVYWPHGSELDTRPLLQALHAVGHTCVLPVVIEPAAPLEFRRWTPETELQPAALGIPVPVGTEAAVPEVIAAPLLAFDEAGFRLGQGGGFYDRTIAALRQAGDLVVAGVAFEMQRVEKVPRDGYDLPVDWMVTDAATRVIVT